MPPGGLPLSSSTSRALAPNGSGPGIAQGKQHPVANVGLVVGHHHRAAAGDHGLPLLVDVGVVGHRLRIEGNDIFPVGGQEGTTA